MQSNINVLKQLKVLNLLVIAEFVLATISELQVGSQIKINYNKLRWLPSKLDLLLSSPTIPVQCLNAVLGPFG